MKTIKHMTALAKQVRAELVKMAKEGNDSLPDGDIEVTVGFRDGFDETCYQEGHIGLNVKVANFMNHEDIQYLMEIGEREDLNDLKFYSPSVDTGHVHVLMLPKVG